MRKLVTAIVVVLGCAFLTGCGSDDGSGGGPKGTPKAPAALKAPKMDKAAGGGIPAPGVGPDATK